MRVEKSECREHTPWPEVRTAHRREKQKGVGVSLWEGSANFGLTATHSGVDSTKFGPSGAGEAEMGISSTNFPRISTKLPLVQPWLAAQVETKCSSVCPPLVRPGVGPFSTSCCADATTLEPIKTKFGCRLGPNWAKTRSLWDINGDSTPNVL